MIPILFAENETNTNHNGIGALHETIDYEVTESTDGVFELSLEYPVSGQWFKELKDFRLILAKPNDVDEPHLFRIYELVTDTDTESVKVSANTKTNDLAGNLVLDVVISNETPQAAMNKMKANLVEPTDYNFVSDIQTTSSTRWTRRNPLNCILGSDGSLVDNWGGELKRTNNTIYLYSRRGKDKVTTIRPGRSLEGFKMTSSVKGMITRILPYFTYTPEGSTKSVTVTGTIVNSPLVDKYPIKFIEPIDFTQYYDEVIDLTSLNAKAATYFTKMNPDCDKPNVQIEVDMLQLSDSSEYSKFKDLEHIQLYDTVIVYVPKYDVDVEVKITSVTYNGMKEQVTQIVAGTESTSLYSDVKNTYIQDVSELQKYVRGVEKGIYNTIQIAADGNTTIFRGYTEPDISISKPNDLWYEPSEEGGTILHVFDGAYWQIDKVSANLLKGTIDAENGDVNLINVNVSTLVGNVSDFIRSYWNDINSQVYIDGDELSITNLSTGVKVTFQNGEIIFRQGSNVRYLRYTNEGLMLVPGEGNTGTGLNGSLHIQGGIAYLQFTNNQQEVMGRIEFDNPNDLTKFFSENEVQFIRYSDGLGVGVAANGFRTVDNSGNGSVSTLIGDRWEVPGDGKARNLYAKPNGTGSFVAGDSAGNRWNMVASDFVKQSTRESKTEISPLVSEGMAVINRLKPVSYKKKDKLARGIDEVELGFIAEDNLDVATPDVQGIYDSHIVTYLVKALQEKDAELQNLKQLLTEKGVI